ncbi:50S ribosomal protein L3 [Leptospirillum ferriphilum]|uniref:Large ribosomal subunit protein uL3 n=2 Tax=Leptospirillum TaxID=179 RepID=A0A094X1X9_9BACT|nr:50S ribosomal protein L3 [Leptospirillum ferriphilum]EDZ39156.1 MAG: Ribosomal protein L3 [Leptospirillum sp. Group II '5-way CG']KGA92524.1 LSU ribosomal protein L3p (L3e) [Leptospirillum ferriphilum]
MKTLLGRKLGMTQIYLPSGQAVPVTIVEAGPCEILQVKTSEKEGYSAAQIGYFPISPKHLNKPERGHQQKYAKNLYRYVREFKVEENTQSPGSILTVEIFQEGDSLDITGQSKGKGFAGVMKRHHFRGGDATHGSMFHREPGSIGSSAYPSRVLKNKKLPGHMGDKRITVKNLKLIAVKPEANLLFIKGAIPGSNGSFVVVNKNTIS